MKGQEKKSGTGWGFNTKGTAGEKKTWYGTHLVVQGESEGAGENVGFNDVPCVGTKKIFWSDI